jgi:hypothetical protein
MRKHFSLVLVLALTITSMPLAAAPAGKASAFQQGGINGIARGADKAPLPNYTVRVRNAADGQIAGTTTTSAAGSFTFADLQPGSYVIEIVDAAGRVVGLSPAIAVTAGAAVSVTVSATAAGAIATASAGGFSLFGLGTLATVGLITAAGVATVAGVVATRSDASPSR